jgi:hypothetical protein
MTARATQHGILVSHAKVKLAYRPCQPTPALLACVRERLGACGVAGHDFHAWLHRRKFAAAVLNEAIKQQEVGK